VKRNDEPVYLVITNYGYQDVVIYVHWLYTGQIPTRPYDRKYGTMTEPIWLDLANAYVFLAKRPTTADTNKRSSRT
jgi:hypothetical protein